jgi:very-short-patch-repair endonuclease
MPKSAEGGVKIRVGPAQFQRFAVAAGLPKPEAEFRFHPTRKFRLDFAWVQHKVGLEIDGGIWTGGRHTRGAGWLKDTEKLNLLASMGWRMLRCTPQQLCTSEMLDTIKQALAYKEAA